MLIFAFLGLISAYILCSVLGTGLTRSLVRDSENTLYIIEIYDLGDASDEVLSLARSYFLWRQYVNNFLLFEPRIFPASLVPGLVFWAAIDIFFEYSNVTVLLIVLFGLISAIATFNLLYMLGLWSCEYDLKGRGIDLELMEKLSKFHDYNRIPLNWSWWVKR